MIITVERTYFKREAMSFFPPTLHKVHSCEIFGMPSFMCPCSEPSERWAASLQNLIVTIGGGGQQIRTQNLEAFIHVQRPFHHIRHDGEHSGFVCSSPLRFGCIFCGVLCSPILLGFGWMRSLFSYSDAAGSACSLASKLLQFAVIRDNNVLITAS